jgi:VWFA-related protein
MRRLMLLALAAAIALPATASHRVTVAQVEQALAADSSTHRVDAEIARQVSEFEMTERLTAHTLDRFAADFKLGPRTALALQLLSDQSVFLDPPASELPATAFPDEATQQRMLEAARAYSVQTWSQLPNFFVKRQTVRFDDSAQVVHKGDWPVRLGMHPVGTSSRQITFRDGKEVQDPSAQSASTGEALQQELGLRSWGEFGPAVTVVLGDLANRKAEFSHWEQSPTGLAAVFHYQVPREASHYAVAYTYLNNVVIGRTQFGYAGRDRSAQQVNSIPRTKELQTYRETPGYHGELSIDPATGAILRLTIEAELGSGDPLLRAATVIEYGPVNLGDRKFICPVRSIAVSTEPGSLSGCSGPKPMGDISGSVSPASACAASSMQLINETSFQEYHRLGSTMRIVTDEAGTGSAGTRSATPGVPNPSHATDSDASAAPNPAQPVASSELASNVTPPAAGATVSTPPTLPALPAPPSQPVVPEVTMSASTGLPDQPADLPANAPRPQNSDYSLKVVSRLVDVGIVVWDKKGHPIKDLKADEFEVYDNGQKQEIRYFAAYSAEATAPVPSAASATDSGASVSAAPEHAFANRAADGGSPSAAAGATILLIDESHVAWADLNHARQEMLRFLANLGPGERVGLYSITRTGIRILREITTDHAALSATLKAWMPTAQSVSQAQDEEMRNRQQFDEVHSTADLNSVNGNLVDVPDSQATTDPLLRSMGSNPARESLIQLVTVARHLSAIPGHKNLVWVSSDNVFADWESQAVGIDKSPKMVESFALHAQEAMNEAHVAVYPFDVSQLESAAITADIRTRNVELTPAAQDNATLAASAGGSAGGSASSGGRNMTPGRITAEMQQDTHPVQGPVREVAAATGGRVIRRSADLSGELAGIVEDGHATYMASFAPSGQADDKYHTITVKLTGHRGAALRYRTGYMFQKEPTTLKDRFQQAVWRPMDANEISVAADLSPSGSGANVKIKIAASDLGLEQQAGRWMDKIDIFFIQRDDEGHHAQVEGQTLGLRLKSSTYERLMPAGVPFEHFVEMHPGMASMRVLVVDENSGRMGSITIPAPALRAKP